MKKLLIVLLICLFPLFSCEAKKEEDKSNLDYDSDAEVSYGEFSNEDYLYGQMHLYFGDQEIPVYACKINYSHSWHADAPQRIDNGVAVIEIKGKAKLKLTTSFNMLNRTKIRPLDKNVQFEQTDDKELEFVISEVGQYTIEFYGDRCLHLFVSNIGEYDSYKNQSGVIYFGPGLHNKSNNSKISSDNYVHLSSNQTIFIDKGAVVEAGFIANNASNITIVGNGIISGAVFPRSATANTKLIPFDFNYCNNIKFIGISNLDPAGWCYNLYFSKNILLDNIKIISSRSNGDGVSLQSCEDAKVLNSFVRSWDDSLVVKNYPRWDNRNIEGTTRNILFKNCIIWTDLAQSMEIGFETVGEIMEDITFEDITVLHNYHKAVISIHNSNNANIKRVTFKNITVEDAAMGKGDGKNYLIEISNEYSTTWSTGHKVTSLGSTEDVLIENVKVLSSNKPMISIRGAIDARSEYSNEIHYVKNVKIKDLYLGDVKIDNNYEKLELIYTQNITFE